MSESIAHRKMRKVIRNTLCADFMRCLWRITSCLLLVHALALLVEELPAALLLLGLTNVRGRVVSGQTAPRLNLRALFFKQRAGNVTRLNVVIVLASLARGVVNIVATLAVEGGVRAPRLPVVKVNVVANGGVDTIHNVNASLALRHSRGGNLVGCAVDPRVPSRGNVGGVPGGAVHGVWGLDPTVLAYAVIIHPSKFDTCS